MQSQYLLRIPTELKIKLEEIAKEKGISLKALLTIELRKYVEDWEKSNRG